MKTKFVKILVYNYLHIQVWVINRATIWYQVLTHIWEYVLFLDDGQKIFKSILGLDF